MKKYAIIVGIAACAAVLAYVVFCHQTLSAFKGRVSELEARVATLEFRFAALHQNSDTSLFLCARMITAMENRQRSLESIVLTNESLNLTLKTVRAYNAGAPVVRATNHDAIGGEP